MLYRFIRPLLFSLDAERAHETAISSLRLLQGARPLCAWMRRLHAPRSSLLTQRLFGVEFPGPVGLAAGFDKNAEVVRGLSALGFGFLEVGTVTPKAQPGNEKPRAFRWTEERSLVNRLGFNNQGGQAMAARLEDLAPDSLGVPTGINLGKNKTTSNDNALEDYRTLARLLGPHAAYLVLNLSSPNTPGLRALQDEGFVRELFGAVGEVSDRPLLLKLAPDLEPKSIQRLARCAVENGAAGIIATNTTNAPELLERFGEQGGVSGALLREKSRSALEAVVAELDGEWPVIAVGGIDSLEEVWWRLRAGASLVQLYTALVYQGPMLAARLHRSLSERLQRQEKDSVSEIIGAGRVVQGG